MLKKDELRTKIKLKIQSAESLKEVTLVDKKNWFSLDSSYKIIKDCKWIDNTTFRFKPKELDYYVYYLIETDKVESNIDIEEHF